MPDTSCESSNFMCCRYVVLSNLRILIIAYEDVYPHAQLKQEAAKNAGQL